MKPKVGPLLLSDFGETRLGPGPHYGDIMPMMYRAPETLLYIPWSYPVDIWSVGLTVSEKNDCNSNITNLTLAQAWDLLEGKTLFTARKDDGSFSDGVHFSEMMAALGPPPQELLDQHRARALEYWNEEGSYCQALVSGLKAADHPMIQVNGMSSCLSQQKRAWKLLKRN